MGNEASAIEIAALTEPIKSEDSQDTVIKKEEPVKETIEVKEDAPVVIPAKVEPKVEAKVEPKVEPAKDDFKAEMVKRFGERPDEELYQQSWKSYKEMEKEFDRRNVLTKELLETVDKFGGLAALKQILATPKEQLKQAPVSDKPVESKSEFPEDIQKLIDEGEIDLQSPKDQMFIRRELAYRQEEADKTIANQRVYESKQQEAVKQFETFLTTDIATKYEYADLNAIKAKAYAGAWRGLSDEAFKVAVENEAKALHDKVNSLADTRTESKLAEFRKIKEKSVVVGKSIATPAKGKVSFREAFDAAYAENFGGRN